MAWASADGSFRRHPPGEKPQQLYPCQATLARTTDSYPILWIHQSSTAKDLPLLRISGLQSVVRLEILLAVSIGLAAGCSKPGQQPVAENPSTPKAPSGWEVSRPEESVAGIEKTGPGDLRAAAEAGNAPAQRELAARMLFGKGMAADPAGAMVWVERAARGGDARAALWMGRKFLNEPQDRVSAAAWFLVAAAGDNPSVSQDVAGELEALALSPQELDRAKSLKAKLKAEITGSSE